MATDYRRFTFDGDGDDGLAVAVAVVVGDGTSSSGERRDDFDTSINYAGRQSIKVKTIPPSPDKTASTMVRDA